MVHGERYRFRIRAENIHGVSEPGNESEFVRIPMEGETQLYDDEEGEEKGKLGVSHNETAHSHTKFRVPRLMNEISIR